MYENLQKKICVVTGAARGIGLGITEGFCQEGSLVAMIDIDGDEAKIQARRLCDSGFKVVSYQLDITLPEKVKKCFSSIESELGPVDILINNAGLVTQKPLEEIMPEQIDQVMKVNVYGTLYCIQAVTPGMKKKKYGRIINFSSKSGKTGSALMADYSAAKGAIIAMTQALAFELAPFNITVNCLCPGITDQTGVWNHVSSSYIKHLKLPHEEIVKKFTAKVPLGRLADIQDIVNFTLFVAAKADYCTGQSFNITGGREVH